jgi:methylase of polypeptide subunit release factors
VITREALASARDLAGAVELFRALGYEVSLRRVDPEAWSSSDVRLRLQDGWELYHGCRCGRLDLFFLRAEASSARPACNEFLQGYRGWNANARIVVVTVHETRWAIHGLDQAGRVRRLDISSEAPSAEVLERLNLLSRVDHQADTAAAFERCLEREGITRQFFVRFRQSVERLAAELAAQCHTDAQTLDDQALLVLSRILFLYFVQQKGWLDENPRFLVHHFSRVLDEGANYYDSVLRPLFFGCLNTPVLRRSGRALELGRIPYLNGGLFEPSAFERSHPDISVSNELLQDILEKTFERYAFCVDEGDDEGLHVDPEMLGRVFESLMAEEERLRSGSFYTPRTIVDAMTERAILAWCGEGDETLSREIAESRLEVETARQLLRKLEAMTVLDPACGSGAFLLSALQTIERLTMRLSDLAGEPRPRNLRQRIVERSLHGVDIKPQAVRLCELRLWLSIVSSSAATLDSVDPLPNLDRNILQGDALLGPLDFLADRIDVYRQWSYALRARKELLDRYRHALPDEKPALCRSIRESDQVLAVTLLASALRSDSEELDRMNGVVPGLFGAAPPPQGDRHRLEDRIAGTERHLARAQEGVIDFFAFELHFAHVFAGGGFDVVLGNPPWVRSRRIEPRMRRMLADRYELFQAGRGFDQSDLCLAFWEKALRLNTPGGVVAMLLPAKIATSRYGAALRRSVVRSAQLIAIDDWSDDARNLFDADTFPVALTVRKAHPSRGVVAMRRGDSLFEVPREALSSAEAGSVWQLVSPDVLEILGRLRKRFATFEQVLNRRPLMGVKTGSNERFLVSDLEFRGGGAYIPGLDLKVPPEALARVIRGRDVRRWKAAAGSWMLLPPARRGARVPAWTERLVSALGISAEEFRLAYVQPEHFGVKVVWKDVSRGLQAVVLPPSTTVDGREFPVVPNQTLYLVDAVALTEAFALAGLLNSTIFNALVVAVADRAKDWHYRYFGSTISQIPVPALSESDMRQLATLSRRAHRGHQVQRELDALVRKVYRLAGQEVRVLESFLAQRLGQA